MLAYSTDRSRHLGKELLQKLEPAIRVDAVVRLLSHSLLVVRTPAIELMNKMEPSQLQEYAPLAVSSLASET